MSFRWLHQNALRCYRLPNPNIYGLIGQDGPSDDATFCHDWPSQLTPKLTPEK
jgi:hypothetical protein